MRHPRHVKKALGAYWSVLAGEKALVELLHWSGVPPLSFLDGLGLWGFASVMFLPALLIVLGLLWKQSPRESLGVLELSNGKGRDAAFQKPRQDAEHNITIVGVGMRNVAPNALTLLAQAKSGVVVNFYMLDPAWLREHPGLAEAFGRQFASPNFVDQLENNYTALRAACTSWNSDHKHLCRLF